MCEKTLRYPWETWKEGIKKEGRMGEEMGTRSIIYLSGNTEQPKNLGEAFFNVETL